MRTSSKYHTPFTSPICFSFDSRGTLSDSLRLAVRGSRSFWKSKPDMEYDRARVGRGDSASSGPSESSNALSESSESCEAREYAS